ncbi:hypothetical protein CDL12_15293 [Handroanthus impetiginosus]|uniref:Uncharacterized protein n=1 Tax=Handroanthus impetiginosus TaxID=429701 RepID=A0A2G9H3L1_9LAMI|nr:hypothetical protein CDL12_15293 [Handroanthus impetiginosus]
MQFFIQRTFHLEVCTGVQLALPIVVLIALYCKGDLVMGFLNCELEASICFLCCFVTLVSRRALLVVFVGLVLEHQCLVWVERGESLTSTLAEAKRFLKYF